jgi:AcrR family transcriptional regulator
MAEAMDRRAVRTRKALHAALLALILRKDYEAITVQDIIDEADVSRSTFYAHYTGKEDLLRRGFERFRADLMEGRRGAVAGSDGAPGEPLRFSLAMFEHACEYKQIYRALVGGRGGTIAVNELRRVLTEVVRKDQPRPHDDTVPPDVRIRFIVDTFVTMLTWWLERNPGKSPSEVNAIFRRLVIHGAGPLN